MTGLASDTYFGLLAGVAARLGIVVLGVARGMAFGAAGIPILVRAGPMKAVTRTQILVRVEVVPALADIVPSQVERLQTAWLAFEQVLLQGLDAGRIFDLEFSQPTVRSIGLDVMATVTDREPCRDAIVFDAGAVKVAEDARFARRLPRPSVMGALPCLRHGLVAGGTAI